MCTPFWLKDKTMNFLPTDVSKLSDMLKRASEAHHTYEAKLGKPDADWPTFYAQYMLGEPIASTLPHYNCDLGRMDEPLVDAIVEEKLKEQGKWQDSDHSVIFGN